MVINLTFSSLCLFIAVRVNDGNRWVVITNVKLFSLIYFNKLLACNLLAK